MIALVRTISRVALPILLVAGLSACNTMSRLSEVGSGPDLSKIEDPQAKQGYQPVSLPMPTPTPAERNPNSLWRAGSKAFFKDQRASKVGDLITVEIEIKDQAKLSNQTNRARDNMDTAKLNNFLGFEDQGFFEKITPKIDMESNLSNSGKGAIVRSETVDLKLAAIITQTLPNGNLVLQGKQEVRVNQELRDLVITGVIRPEDVTSTNTVSYEKIAEARISYGGRGQVSDVQQPRYGQQIFDILMPF